MPTGPTGIVSSPGGDLATTDSGGKGATAEEIVLNISTKIVKVEKLLKGSIAIKKDARDDARKAAEIDENKEQEKALEKIKKPKGSSKFKVPIPGKSLLEKVFGFFTTVMFGWLAVRLVDWMPKLIQWLKPLANFADMVIDGLVIGIDFLANVIDFGYKLVGKIGGWVKDTYGEEGAEKFRTFLGNLKDLISGFLIWKILGEKIFKSIVGAIKNVWKSVTRAIRTVWVKLRRLIGRKARMFFKNVAKRAGGVVKNVGQGILNVGKRAGAGILNVGKRAGAGILNVGKNIAGRVGGLFGGTVGKTASGVGKVAGKVGGFAAKIFGKAAGVIGPALKGAMPAIKGFAKRIPIFGSLIVALVSLMSGEPVGQALFKGVGAALGGALGSFIPIPFLGTLLGETFGMFIGDALYYGIIERDWKKAGKILKQHLMGVFKAGKVVFDWVTGGFSRFYEGIPKFKVPDFPDEPPSFIPGFGFGSKKKIWNAFKGGIKFLIGPLSLLLGKEIPNLLWLVNPMNTAPLLVKSFFSPGEGESSKKSAPSASESVGKGDDDKSKGIEKQEKELIAANQKNGYDGVMEKLESYAPYEESGGDTTITIPSPVGGGSSIDEDDKANTSRYIPFNVSGGRDPYEILYMGG